MNKSAIISAINNKTSNTPYSSWRIGLTHNLDERKQQWKDTEYHNINHWNDWQTDSLQDAQDIEYYFTNKDMKGRIGDNLSSNKPVYVYVF